MGEVMEKDDRSVPFLSDDASATSSTYSLAPVDPLPIKRTGTVWTAIAHIITGVIGSGVLSLAWSMAQLGWIAGPLCMVLFAIITIYSSSLLCDCYRFPDPEVGHVRNRSYAKAVRSYLGRKYMVIAGVFLQESYYGYGIAYTITSAISLRAILEANCYHKNGHDAPCQYGGTWFMLVFGAVQLIFSQIPDFQNMESLSIIAAVMSFAYTFIGLGLGIAKVVENGEIKGTLGGTPAPSVISKVWLLAQALGDIAFSFTYNIILVDIQDTLEGPAENKKMKKASTTSILITTFFFMCCGCFGYAAFGEQTPGNLLTGFGFYEPYWLVDLANACIVLHLVGGYQIFSQPLFAAVERKMKKYHPNSGFVNNDYMITLPLLPQFRVNLFRVCFRIAYVASTTIIGILFPYFNQVLGVLGALNFWPMAIYFPIEMYLAQNHVTAWSGKWIFLQGFKIVCLFFTMIALIGSVHGLISNRLH